MKLIDRGLHHSTIVATKFLNGYILIGGGKSPGGGDFWPGGGLFLGGQENKLILGIPPGGLKRISVLLYFAKFSPAAPN